MGLNEGLPAGATPLDGEELEGLLPTHLVNRSQLNEWEQQNIEAALLWLSRQRRPRPLEESWLRRLHREMFGQSWRWAGQYRNSDKSIGGDWRQIRMQVTALLADIAYQVEHRVDGVDQIALRLRPEPAVSAETAKPFRAVGACRARAQLVKPHAGITQVAVS